MRHYQLAAEIPKNIATALAQFHPLEQKILYRQGVSTAEEALHYLSPVYEEQHDSFLLHDMEKAVARIEKAMSLGEKITIFSDYDCDGIPGAVVLADFFTARGYENFVHYIPHRHFEGFGLSTDAVEKISADGTTLIITIDCGTSDKESILRAGDLGVDVIVTDHHEPPAELPPAVAVVNPKVGDSYPFPHLCGAAVVFKLVQALLKNNRTGLPEGGEKWWLDMVGLATLADMVPLQGENRIFAHYGLTVLRKSRRPGLQQLLQKQRVNQKFITEDDIGFTIGPRINAASRMDAPEDALHLLKETDVGKAEQYVSHLEKLNTTRKAAVAQMTKQAHKKMSTFDSIPAVICIGDPEWRPSLVGLVAGKLAEEHNRPAFVWGRDGNGVLKGSCRSGGSSSVVALMEGIADSFLEYGGHRASGGFSVKEEKIHTFAEDLQRSVFEQTDTSPVEPIHIDSELRLEDITPELLRRLAALGPYGTGNHKPLFLLKDIAPREVVLFGKAKEHTKLLFDAGKDHIEAIAFFNRPTDFTVEPKADTTLSLVANLEQSFFMGRRQIRLRVVDCVQHFEQ